MKLPTFRQIKQKGRMDIHEKLKVEGFYLKDPLDKNPVKITVRVWTKWLELGKITGNWTEFDDATAKILFLRSEVPNPKVGALVSISKNEAYRISEVEAPDGLTITAKVTVIPESTPYLSDLPYPSDE